jgi:hypothetical protein
MDEWSYFNPIVNFEQYKIKIDFVDKLQESITMTMTWVFEISFSFLGQDDLRSAGKENGPLWFVFAHKSKRTLLYTLCIRFFYCSHMHLISSHTKNHMHMSPNKCLDFFKKSLYYSSLLLNGKMIYNFD